MVREMCAACARLATDQSNQAGRQGLIVPSTTVLSLNLVNVQLPFPTTAAGSPLAMANMPYGHSWHQCWELF